MLLPRDKPLAVCGPDLTDPGASTGSKLKPHSVPRDSACLKGSQAGLKAGVPAMTRTSMWGARAH